MKKLFLLLLLVTFSSTVFAQTTSIEFTKDKTLVLNEVTLTKATTMDDINSLLGTPEVYKEYLSGKTNYHYKDLGISVHTVDGHLLFIGANFNWDGDKTFPETAYKGSFKIDGVSFNQESTEEEMKEISNVELLGMMPGLFMSNPKVEPIAMIIGFKEDRVTQIGFEIQ